MQIQILQTLNKMYPLLLLQNSEQSRPTFPKPVLPYRITRLGVVAHIINAVMYHHTPFGLFIKRQSACQILGLSHIFKTKASRKSIIQKLYLPTKGVLNHLQYRQWLRTDLLVFGLQWFYLLHHKHYFPTFNGGNDIFPVELS